MIIIRLSTANNNKSDDERGNRKWFRNCNNRRVERRQRMGTKHPVYLRLSAEQKGAERGLIETISSENSRVSSLVFLLLLLTANERGAQPQSNHIHIFLSFPCTLISPVLCSPFSRIYYYFYNYITTPCPSALLCLWLFNLGNRPQFLSFSSCNPRWKERKTRIDNNVTRRLR